MLIKIIATALMCFSLCACETLRFWSSNDGCRAIYQATADQIVLKGVKIPIKYVAGGSNIELGELTVTPNELSAVTESVRIAQESRLRQCNFLKAMREATPPATAEQIGFMSDAFVDADRATDLLVKILSDPKRGGEFNNAAQGLRDAATSEEGKFKKAVEKSRTPIKAMLEELRKSFPDYTDRLKALADADARLNDQLVALRAPKVEAIRIGVTGFRSGSSALSPEMRKLLEVNLQAAIATRVAQGPIALSITGYADATGSSLQNLGVGMQRASAVASHIHRTFAERVEIRSISSGGVKLNDPDARRVEVTVLTTFVGTKNAAV